MAPSLVPLAEQDRGRWDPAAIAEGVALITDSLATTAVGRYQLQAAIAAVHDGAARAEDTDWHEILGLHELLRAARTTLSLPERRYLEGKDR